jgi:acetone carboxylase gamma subunit
MSPKEIHYIQCLACDKNWVEVDQEICPSCMETLQVEITCVGILQLLDDLEGLKVTRLANSLNLLEAAYQKLNAVIQRVKDTSNASNTT